MADLTYRQQLALYCLAFEGEPCTGAELVELMGTTAQDAGHAKQFWIDFTPAKIVRDLQELEKKGLVTKAKPFHCSLRGRDLPTWTAVRQEPAQQLVLPQPAALPEASGHVVQVQPRPVAGGPLHQFEGMPVHQLLLLLDIHDQLAGATARYLREVQELNNNARDRLIRAGLVQP
ncbi:MAG TPA: hypothetical protein VGE09_06440 [Pseudoxanthomonas sp.]